MAAEFIVVCFIHVRGTPRRLPVAYRGKEPTDSAINTILLLVVLIKDEMGKSSRIALNHHRHDADSFGKICDPSSKAGGLKSATIPHPDLRIEFVVLVSTSASVGSDVKNEAVSGLKFWPFLLEPPFDRVRT